MKTDDVWEHGEEDGFLIETEEEDCGDDGDDSLGEWDMVYCYWCGEKFSLLDATFVGENKDRAICPNCAKG